jgi:hypothetical protein
MPQILHSQEMSLWGPPNRRQAVSQCNVRKEKILTPLMNQTSACQLIITLATIHVEIMVVNDFCTDSFLKSVPREKIVRYRVNTEKKITFTWFVENFGVSL